MTPHPAGTAEKVDAPGASIERAEAYRLDVPLTVPYENALGPLSSFDTILIRLVDGKGRDGWGEACPVVGYSPESPDEAWQYVCRVLPRLQGLTAEDIEHEFDSDLPNYPFVVSALHEAMVDLQGGFESKDDDGPQRLELLGIVNTLDAERAPDLACELVAKGYRTLKVKVGYDADADARRVTRIADAVNGEAKLRLDANQGYSVTQALQFARRISVDSIEVFEQPVHAQDWTGIETIAHDSPLPIMLDESIYGDKDIQRASRIRGITAIKLKMSKSGGPAALARQVARCREYGLEVVVGNGIATDLGCLHESRCYVRMGLTTAGEMNGFLKATTLLLSAPLVLKGAQLILPRSSDVSVIVEKIASLAKARASVT